MDNVTVTVLMPVFNGGKYIAEAIDSVIRQSYTHYELLIIDDGSTDNTLEVIRSFEDARIRVISQSNAGVAAALNKGLEHAKGKYIARFDADDVCLPSRLQVQVQFLDTHPDYIVVGSEAEYISEENDHLFHFKSYAHQNNEIQKTLYTHCPFIHSSVMFRKEVVTANGGYLELAHNMEDYLLWIQISKAGKFHNLAQPLIKVRFNSASVTIDEKWRGKRFRTLKQGILKRGTLSAEESTELLTIIRKQNSQKIKQGSYYAICGKKFLVNNYQPRKAREHLKKAIDIYPLRLDNYALLLASFFPYGFIRWLHKKTHP